MAKNVQDSIKIEGAKLIFKNFSGKESQFNPSGKRNFCVIIDDDLAKALKKDGWNVKQTKPRDDDDEPEYYLPVAVAYGYRPPKIVVIKGRKRINITEDTVDMLDWAYILNADLRIRPYNWELQSGAHGVKAYLSVLYITLEEDDLDKKYDDLLDSEEDTEMPF